MDTETTDTTIKRKIKLSHPGLELSELFQQLEASPSPIVLNDIGNNSKRIVKLKSILFKFIPTNFEEFVWLFKTTSMVFMTSKCFDDSNTSLNLLRQTFQMNGKNWDINPIHLHILSKEIFDSLKYDKNIIYFARKISNISRMSLYISLCLVWAVFFKTIKIDVNMYRIHKFSEIITHIQNMDTIKCDENQVYILLESILFLLLTITAPKISEQINKRYKLYFEYEKQDLLELKAWCLRLNRMYTIKSSDKEFNYDYSAISDVIELDILDFLQNIYPSDDDTDDETE